MGSLVLIRKIGQCVRVYNEAKTRFYEIELMSIGQDGVLISISRSHDDKINTTKIPFNEEQTFSGGDFEIGRISNKQVKMLFDLPRHINVVRKELLQDKLSIHSTNDGLDAMRVSK